MWGIKASPMFIIDDSYRHSISCECVSVPSVLPTLSAMHCTGCLTCVTSLTCIHMTFVMMHSLEHARAVRAAALPPAGETPVGGAGLAVSAWRRQLRVVHIM